MPSSCRFSDAYAGKKAKLVETQVLNKNGTYLRYGSADYNFTNIGDDVIAWPSSPSADWSKWSIINLNGNRTYPIPTAAFAATNTDLRDKGEHAAILASLLNVTNHCALLLRRPLEPCKCA